MPDYAVTILNRLVEFALRLIDKGATRIHVKHFRVQLERLRVVRKGALWPTHILVHIAASRVQFGQTWGNADSLREISQGLGIVVLVVEDACPRFVPTPRLWVQAQGLLH